MQILVIETFISMVPAAGLEPARLLSRGILSPLCLPIPPSGLSNVYHAYLSIIYVLGQELSIGYCFYCKMKYIYPAQPYI